MDDRVLALCELSNDLLFQKIPRERISYYVDASLAAGRSAAAAFSGRDVRTLYAENGIQIKTMGSGKQGYGVILRGQASMSREGCAVEVYTDSIRELALHSGWEGRTLTEDEAMNVHLAHEFFHIWEYRNDCSIVDQLEPVTTLALLGWRRTAHIHRCGEIAAHAFAKALLDLPVLPNLYDYLYLIDTGKMTRDAFHQLTARMAALLNTSGTDMIGGTQ